jgi:hypothetical protein
MTKIEESLIVALLVGAFALVCLLVTRSLSSTDTRQHCAERVPVSCVELNAD